MFTFVVSTQIQEKDIHIAQLTRKLQSVTVQPQKDTIVNGMLC